MTEKELAMDGPSWGNRHQTTKAKVADAVNDEIAATAATSAHEDEARLGELAGRLRDSAIDESAKDERAIGQARAAARGSQFINYGFGVIFALLATRLVLALIAARSSNGFVQLVTTVTDPFYAPFRGIVPSPAAPSGHTLVVPLVIAIAAYALLLLGINGLLRVVVTRKTRI